MGPLYVFGSSYWQKYAEVFDRGSPDGGGLGAKVCAESGKSSKLLIKGDVMPSLLDIAPNVPISGGIQVAKKSLVTVWANPNPVYQMGIHVMAQ